MSEDIRSDVRKGKPASVRQADAPLLYPVYSWSHLHQAFPLRLTNPLAFDIIRHGESTGNALGTVTGTLDASLTARGMEQARCLSNSIRPYYDLAYCSAMTRSIQTLRLAVESRALVVHCFSDQRINERSLGVLEGKIRRSVHGFANGDLSFAPKGGESYLEVTRRVLSFLVDLVSFVNHRHRSSYILISTHAGPLRVLSGILEDLHEPREILAREFANARVYSRVVDEISWPRFLSGPEFFDG